MSNEQEENSKTAIIHSTHQNVREVYRKCVGEDDGLSTLSMVTNMENKLEKQFDFFDSMPSSIVETAEKQREKERRQTLRKEKLEEQNAVQEERARKAYERAQASATVQQVKINRHELYKPRLLRKEKRTIEKKVVTEQDELLKYL
jgi:uncharacterized protein YfeS